MQSNPRRITSSRIKLFGITSDWSRFKSANGEAAARCRVKNRSKSKTLRTHRVGR